jgi:hypothetical protein
LKAYPGSKKSLIIVEKHSELEEDPYHFYEYSDGELSELLFTMELLDETILDVTIDFVK